MEQTHRRVPTHLVYATDPPMVDVLCACGWEKKYVTRSRLGDEFDQHLQDAGDNFLKEIWS